MKMNDTIGGSVFLALGVTVSLYSPTLNDSYSLIGPGTFPFAVGILIALSGAAILIGSFFAQPTDAEDGENVRLTVDKIVTIGVIPVAVVAYALLVETLGALFMNFIVVTAVSVAWGQKVWSAALIGVVTSIVVYLFFRVTLNVPLPSGFIEEMIR